MVIIELPLTVLRNVVSNKENSRANHRVLLKGPPVPICLVLFPG